MVARVYDRETDSIVETSCRPVVSSADAPSEQVATCHAHGLTDGMSCCDLHDETFDPSQGEVCTGCYEVSEQPITLGFAPGGCMIDTHSAGAALTCHIDIHITADELDTLTADLLQQADRCYNGIGALDAERRTQKEARAELRRVLARRIKQSALAPCAPPERAKAHALLDELIDAHVATQAIGGGGHVSKWREAIGRVHVANHRLNVAISEAYLPREEADRG